MALTVVSCVEPLAPQPGLRDGAFGINLSVVCKSPDTKATKPGEDQYNENALNRIDWFVFKDGTEAAIAHGRIIGSNGVVASTTVSLDEFADPASGISGKVYVIANLPATRFKHDDAKGILQSTDGGTTWGTAGALTRTALEALEVVASFDALDAGKFKKQDEFVMRGETPFALTPAATTQTVTAPLDRLAAKVTMQLSVVPAIDEIITMPNGDYLYTKTWYPELDKINVYLSYADNHAKIAAAPEDSEDSQAQSSGFFTYNRYAYKTLYSYTGAASSPSATFPSTVTPHWDEDWFWQVTGSPFYTYPIEWKTSSSTAPFIKVILPWTSYDESAGIVAPDGHFVRAGRAKDSSKKGKTQEFYYKIALPSENTTDDKKLQLKCNEWYDLILDVSILGGPSDDLPLELAGQYYVVDWSNPDFTAGGALKQGRYLATARDTFYIYGGNSIEIPVQSSHDISVQVNSANYIDYSSGTAVTESLSSSSYSTLAHGRSSFELIHTLNNNIESADLDCSVITFDVTVTNGAGLEKQVTIIQYPPIYISSERSNGYVFINGNTNRFTNTNYKSVYDDGGVSQIDIYNQSFRNSVTNYTSNSYVQIAVSRSENTDDGQYYTGKRMGTRSYGWGSWQYYDGTISITARNNSNIIRRIVLEYLSVGGKTYDSQDVSYTQNGTQISSSKTEWNGSARSVTITMATDRTYNYQNENNIVTSVTVYYETSAQVQMGTIKSYSYNPTGLNNPNMYTISVSDLSQTDYYIADPRSSTPVSYPSLKQGGSGESLSDYFPVNTSSHNAIAPKLLVASTHGAAISGAMTFESAQKRCASYQENGYPAGRWRIPTDAEIKFMVQLSKNKKLPSLFSGWYWGTSGIDGKYLSVEVETDSQGSITNISVTEENGYIASVRCVYDSWYWGERPVSQNEWAQAGYSVSWLTSWSGWQN